MGLLMLAVVFIVTKEKSNAHTNKSVLGANERIQARTNEFRRERTNSGACARMHAQTDQWLIRCSTSK